MDAQKDEMKEKKISKAVEVVSKATETVSKTVTEAVSKISKPKVGEDVASKILDYLRNRTEEKDGSLVVSEEDYKAFRSEISSVDGRMTIPKGNFLKWAFLVHDWNRQHIFEGYAREAGFETTPAHGTLEAAHAEQYALAYLNKINELTDRLNEKNGLSGESAIENLVYAGHRIEIKAPLYPRLRSATATWNLEDVVVVDNGLDLSFSAVNRRKQNVVECPKVSFRTERKELSEEDISSYRFNILEVSNIEMKRGELATFYECLGKETEDEIYMMHVSAFGIATLLRVSSRRTGKPEGIYASINLNFHNVPDLGIFETTISMPRPPRKILDKETGKEVYAYRFKTLCTQEDIPILTGKIVCYSQTEFKI